MGFPAVYSEMPRLLLNLLFLLGHLRRLSSWLLRLVGAGVDDDLCFDYSDASDFAYFTDHQHHQEQYQHQHQHHGHGLEELEEHSPAVRFDALSAASDSDDGTPPLPEGCSVCLGDFHGAARVPPRLPPRLPRPLGRPRPPHLPALPGAAPPVAGAGVSGPRPPARAAAGVVIGAGQACSGCCLHIRSATIPAGS